MHGMEQTYQTQCNVYNFNIQVQMYKIRGGTHDTQNISTK